MISKEALEYLVELGVDTDKVIEVHDEPYSHLPLKRIPIAEVTPVELNTLESFADFVKSHIAEYGEDSGRLIHVQSPTSVRFISPIRLDQSREVYAKTSAVLPREISYGQFYDVEEFNIALQSRFVDNEHKKLLLKFTGLIKEETIKQTGDDGISQSAVIKTGVTTVDNAVVPNPVLLAPYRTFREIVQPQSLFIFRMKDGPSAALFEADGGAWRLDAIKSIAEYLKESLPGMTILA